MPRVSVINWPDPTAMLGQCQDLIKLLIEQQKITYIVTRFFGPASCWHCLAPPPIEMRPN